MASIAHFQRSAWTAVQTRDAEILGSQQTLKKQTRARTGSQPHTLEIRRGQRSGAGEAPDRRPSQRYGEMRQRRMQAANDFN
nr:hypothetical protein [Comamonas jiangduensis]